MILSKVHIKNFRMLTDVEISFSSDTNKPLTVIRAQNESGKTTLLKALQWGLFGEEVLPNKGRDYRIHHLNLEPGSETKIEVELSFTHHWSASPLTGKTDSTNSEYILKRTAVEEVISIDNFNRTNNPVELYEITEEGYHPIANPKDRLRLIMGSNLKDLFFTDGDDALRFIQDQGSKGHVKKAIKDMLSFDVIKEAIKHVKSCESTSMKESQKFAGGKAKHFANEIKTIDDNLKENESELAKLDEQKREIDTNLNKLNTQIDSLLKEGDKDSLVREKNGLKRAEHEIQSGIENAQKNVSTAFYGKQIGAVLNKNKINDTHNYLSQLRKKGIIPKASLPFLKELLSNEQDCICGRPLKKGSKHFDKLNKMVLEQGENSDLDDRITQLRGISQSYISSNNTAESYLNHLDELVATLINNETKLDEIQGQIKKIQTKIEAIPDNNLKELLKKQTDYNQTNIAFNTKITRYSIEVKNLKKELDFSKRLYENELKKEGKAQKYLKRLNVANDIKKVLINTYESVEKQEIPKVSELLNQLFIKMIKSSEERGLIQKAFVNNNYEIEVIGAGEKRIKTSDLNGASQRALTLAFIMSLAKVSEFIAPNVIDTPLGSMDDVTKKSTLGVLADECKQVVLFLTRSEIRDVEIELDKYMGSVCTMVNSSFYPKKLVNANESEFATSLICKCNHREYCRLCEHYGDESNELFSKRGSE